jgi:hypothetical protein
MRTQQRGQLTLPSGEIYLLDDPVQLRLGVQAMATLPLNAVLAARPVIVRTPTAPVVARRPATLRCA